MQAPRRRQIVRFALGTVAVLVVCLIPWPGLGRTFGSAFVTLAHGTFGNFRTPSQLTIDFERPADDPTSSMHGVGPWHAVLVVRNPETDKATRSALNLRSLAYLPWVVFLALTLGAPIRRDRAWMRSVALGAALTGAFVGTCILVAILSVITSDRVRAIEVGPAVQSGIMSLFWTICETKSPWPQSSGLRPGGSRSPKTMALSRAKDERRLAAKRD